MWAILCQQMMHSRHCAGMQLARETTCVMKTYTLPDGRTIKAGAERFMAPEAMFTPRLVDKECDGLSDVVWSCIQVCICTLLWIRCFSDC